MPFPGCSDSSLLALKDKTGEDGSWFSADTGDSANTSYTEVAEFWELVLSSYSDTSAGDGVFTVANTGGSMVINGGKSAVLSLM